MLNSSPLRRRVRTFRGRDTTQCPIQKRYVFYALTRPTDVRWHSHISSAVALDWEDSGYRQLAILKEGIRVPLVEITLVRRTCPFCGYRGFVFDGKIEPHDPVCRQLAYEHPNVTKYSAPANPDALLGVIDVWDQCDWVMRADFDDRHHDLLRTYRKNGKPRYLPRAKGRRDPERRLLHRKNIANVL